MQSAAAPTHPTPRLHVDGEGLARVTFDDPGRKVNVLDDAVMRRLSELVEDVRERALEGRVRGVLFESARSESFLAGADIDQLGAIESPDRAAEASRLGQAILLDVERLPVPTAAAIRGTCLGGGTELALACTYRLASDHPSTRIGLPEVQLGILPAWGGTTRLPRLIGLQAALDLLLTGKTVDGHEARKIGLVENVLPHALFRDSALAFLTERVEEGPVPTGAQRGLGRRLLEETAPGRRVVLATARRKVLERVGDHYPAPLRILDVVRRSLGRSVERGFRLEAEAAGELIPSGVAKNLLHVFRLREAARKELRPSRAVEPREISDLGVLGAGVMGGGIAHLAATHGIRVRLKDIERPPVAGALAHARSLVEREVSRKRKPSREVERTMERISGGTDYAGFGQLDLVVEAVVERLEVKRTVLKEAEERVSPECILSTNTSTLSVDAMASALDQPERFCGMHFFNPVHRMPLVEVVRGERSSPGTVATVHALALRLGKVPVVVADGPGFLVNRILGPYLNEAGFLLTEGASVQAVDAAATAFGMPMGPLRLVDEVGIDVARHAGDVLHEAFGARLLPAPPLVRMQESGRLGRKGGLGFYRYVKSGRKIAKGEEEVDPDVYELLGDTVPAKRASVEESEIRARLLLAMINEAARALADGIVPSAAEVDLAMVMGTGFPPFRGGLLRFADDTHPRALVQRIDALHGSLGGRFDVAPLLRELARADRGFYESFPAPARE